MKNICVIGVGYVGLTTGTCFADMGNRVTAVDISEERIENLRKGVLPIYEPGLKEVVERNVNAGRLTFSTSYEEGLADAEYVFICVGTPSGVDGEADLQYVRIAAETIARKMTHSLIVINKSTVPVGTGDWVAVIIKESQPKPIKFAVVSCPEFLREGSAIRDFQHPDRTVLGSNDRDAAHSVAQLYIPLRAPTVITDLRTAEMIKYASNAFLATRISFINEIANICEALGADVKEVAQGMGYDKRIGHSFLEAGVGYGGSCFLGSETVYAVEDGRIQARTFKSLFESSGTPFKGDSVEVVTPRQVQVLAFDMVSGQAKVADVHAFTRRAYSGEMVTLKTSYGSSTMTTDHPVIRQTPDGYTRVFAGDLRVGQSVLMLPTLTSDCTNLSPEDVLTDYRKVVLDSIERSSREVTVYSLETEFHTVIVSHGLITSNCFPKDVKALAYMAQVNGAHPELLQAVMEINQFQRKQIVLKLEDLLHDVQGKAIAVLGLAFKENTDDTRESPALDIAEMLHERGAIVRGYDPEAMEHVQRHYPYIHLSEDPYDLVRGADALVIATPWNEFKGLDMARIRDAMKQKILVDGRNLYDPAMMKELGFVYRGVGRGYNGDANHTHDQGE